MVFSTCTRITSCCWPKTIGIARLGDLLKVIQQYQRLLCELLAGGGEVMHGVGLFDSGRQIGPACRYLSVGLRCLSFGYRALQIALAVPGHTLHQCIARAACLRRQQLRAGGSLPGDVHQFGTQYRVGQCPGRFCTLLGGICLIACGGKFRIVFARIVQQSGEIAAQKLVGTGRSEPKRT